MWQKLIFRLLFGWIFFVKGHCTNEHLVYNLLDLSVCQSVILQIRTRINRRERFRFVLISTVIFCALLLMNDVILVLKYIMSRENYKIQRTRQGIRKLGLLCNYALVFKKGSSLLVLKSRSNLAQTLYLSFTHTKLQLREGGDIGLDITLVPKVLKPFLFFSLKKCGYFCWILVGWLQAISVQTF